MVTALPTIQFVLSILGTLLSFALFVSPYRLMQGAYQSYLQQGNSSSSSSSGGGIIGSNKSIHKDQSLDSSSSGSSGTGSGINNSKDDVLNKYSINGTDNQKISSFPYLSMFINCLFWVTYGVLSDNFTLVFVNFIGFIFACYYNWIYFKITNNRESFLTKCSITLFIYIIALGYVMFLVSDHADVLSHLGFLAACSSIIMFGSPLASLKEVIDKKDASSIPLPVALAAACCSLTWALYGLSMGDNSILIPNFIGSVLGALQLGLKIVYQKKRTVFSLLPLSS